MFSIINWKNGLTTRVTTWCLLFWNVSWLTFTIHLTIFLLCFRCDMPRYFQMFRGIIQTEVGQIAKWSVTITCEFFLFNKTKERGKEDNLSWQEKDEFYFWKENPFCIQTDIQKEIRNPSIETYKDKWKSTKNGQCMFKLTFKWQIPIERSENTWT